MAGKQYKNVYTILEKVKKGEIQSHYKDKDGLFGKINFYRKPDLIKPYLHYIDENRLDTVLDVHMRDQTTAKNSMTKFAKSTEFKKLPQDKQPDHSAYYQKFQENYRKIPKHLGKDIFKMYYNQIDKLDFEERDEKNYTKYKFLERANNPVGKIMSENSNLKSAIFTRNVMEYLVARMTMLDFIDADASEKIKNSMNGGSDFDNDGVDEALDKMMDSAQGKKMLDEAMQEAQNLCKEMDNVMDDEMQDQMFENTTKQGEECTAGKISPNYLKEVAAKLESISLSMGSLKEKIKKLLDKSVSYFSSKKETKFEDFLNSDNVGGLEEYELLHPKLRKIFIEDLQVKETKSVGRIDIYIDVSGSMDSGCGITNSNGSYISKIDFCKAFAAKLKSMDMLNDIYVFNNSVKKIKSDVLSISMIGTSGGTTINAAVRRIENNGINALVITDAEDNCEIYSDKAFFIGVKGACFNYFSSDTIEQYSDNNQVIVFDGQSINKVNRDGHEVKK